VQVVTGRVYGFDRADLCASNGDVVSGGGVRRLSMYVVLVVVELGAMWPATGSAQILYRTPERILRLTASSGRLAWAQQRAGTQCFRLYRRSDFGTTPQRMTKCRLDPRTQGRGQIAWVRLVGPAVFWDETGGGNTESDQFVFSTTGLGMLKQPTVYTINCGGSSGAGKTIGPLAPGAPFYSVFTVTTDGACGLLSGTGVVRRIVVDPGGAISHPLVPGAPGPAFLAHAGHRLLEVPGIISNFQIGPTPTLELRGDRSGKLRWSTSFTGAARAIALSARYAVTLVQPSTGPPRIRAYAPGSGRLLRSLAVRQTVLRTVSMAGPRVIFAYPRWIMIWNVRHNLLRRLRRTPHAVRNLAVDGRLVVWNTPHTIHGVVLPAAAP
jgi:hypothetical protein